MQYPSAKIRMIIGYAKAKLRDFEDELLYKIYVTDSLKYIAENTAKQVGGVHLTKRYIDLVEPKEPETPKTPDEIIDEVTKNAGLEVIE